MELAGHTGSLFKGKILKHTGGLQLSHRLTLNPSGDQTLPRLPPRKLAFALVMLSKIYDGEIKKKGNVILNQGNVL